MTTGTASDPVFSTAREVERPTCPQLDQLGEHGDGDLGMGGVTQVETDRHPDPIEQVRRDTPIGQVPEHRLTPLA